MKEAAEQSQSIRRRTGYTAIPNAIMADTRLSIEARGLLALLMSFKEGWVFRASHLMKQCGVGRDKYYRMIGELVEHGYVEKVQTKATDGKFLGAEWVIHDQPRPEKPDTENAASGKPVHLSNTNSVRETNNKTPKPPEGAGDLFSANGKTLDKKPEVDPIEEGFEEIWKAFPRKPNMPGKDLCRREYAKALKKIPHDQLLTAVEAYARMRKGEDPTYHARLSKWLRDGNYESFLTAPEYREEDLSRSAKNLLVAGQVPPSMRDGDGNPNDAALYWLARFGHEVRA